MGNIYRSPEGGQKIKDRYRQFLKYWPVANQHLWIPTCEGETFVIASGPESAPPVILLHGTAFNSIMWMGDIAAWSKHFRLYAVDIIGDAGLSAPSRPSYSSDAHARWLDDVLADLKLKKAAFVGVSLGGWVALDYAIRRAERVKSVVLIAPGGLASKNVLPWALPLMLLGKWGRRKIAERISGPASSNPSPPEQAVSDFIATVFKNMRPRKKSLPDFSDESLKGLTMPVMAILAGKDAFVDSARAKARLEKSVTNLQIDFLSESHHSITNQTQPILEFLRSVHVERDMCGSFIDLGRTRVYEVSADGPELCSGQDAVDLMSAASGQRAAWIAIPVSRFGDRFFELRTQVAGEIVQKFAMYGAKVAIVGGISRRIASSQSLAAFAAEANRGENLWFVESLQELENRLQRGDQE